jgi:hypothetical protein
MTAFDRTWDVLKLMMPQKLEQEPIVDISFDTGEDECCSQFRPALERWFRKGMTCDELYNEVTECVEMIERNQRQRKPMPNHDWVKVVPEIYRQWNECKENNNPFGGME